MSCIRPPKENNFILISEWQIKFCNNNHCAAMLLAYFIGWHDWKIKHDSYYKRVNDIAEMHGDDRAHNEDAYIFFSSEQLIDGLLGFYGKKAIHDALDLLVKLGVISIHKNPNKRYHFDKTKYFKFYPDVCNQWIDENYPITPKKYQKTAQTAYSSDQPKMADAFCKNALPSDKNARYITNTTNNNNQSINPQNFSVVEKNQPQSVDNLDQSVIPIMTTLLQQGMHPKHFGYPDVNQTLLRLLEKGATTEDFINAYAIAMKTTSGFGVNYLAKTVEDLLVKKARNNFKPQTKIYELEDPPHFESDYSKALDWMGDLIQ